MFIFVELLCIFHFAKNGGLLHVCLLFERPEVLCVFIFVELLCIFHFAKNGGLLHVCLLFGEPEL